MSLVDAEHGDLIRSLIQNFNVLADEVQLLSNRKQILEHKLRFAHEQVCTNILPLPGASSAMMNNISSRSGVAKAATTDKHHACF